MARWREPLLLVRRQGLAQPAHQLARARSHEGMRRALLLLLGDDHHVEMPVRVARGDERGHGARDVRLLVGGTRCRNTGVAGFRSSDLLGRAARSSRAYASRTKRTVVSMPFQSRSSLKTARHSGTGRTVNKAATRLLGMARLSLRGCGGSLRIRSPGLTRPRASRATCSMSSGSLRRRSMVRRQPLGLGAELADLALERVHLALHLPHAGQAPAAVAQEHHRGRAHRPRASPRRLTGGRRGTPPAPATPRPGPAPPRCAGAGCTSRSARRGPASRS